MNDTVIAIPLSQLALGFIPVAITLVVFFRWSLNVGNVLYGLGRMLVQLLLIGYILTYIFGAQSSAIVLLVLLVMLLFSGWIAMGPVREQRKSLITSSLIAIAVGGGLTLVVVTQGVLQLDPWYKPNYMVPLAGMAFANAMTAVSLSAERLYAELGHGKSWAEARHTAFQAATIPVVNSLFAVGIVSLPGMMTGQILSGVSPLIAVRYQIMIMCMIFASAGISTAIFLVLCARARAQGS
jgi:UDP-glucose/iron transport system permease protein